MTRPFDEQVQGLDAIVGELASRLAASGADVGGVAGDALAELRSAVEELAVAGEELSTQSDALVADRVHVEEQRRYFEDLFASGPAPSLVTDASGRIVTANEPAAALLGVPGTKLPGKPFSVFVDESSHAPLYRLMQRADRRLRRTHRGDLTLRTRRGEAMQVVAVVAAAPAPDRTLQYRWLLDEAVTSRSYEDLTPAEQEIRSAARHLRFAEEFSRRIIDTVGALVVVLDPSGRILVFNDACERATGYRSEEAVGRDLVELLIPPDDRDEIRSVREALVVSRSGSEHENAWLTRAGDRLRIRWSNTVLVDERGEVTHIIGTGIDVTQERALEAQIMAAQRLEALGHLARGIAHDFNNLLSIMRGHLELLADDVELPERASARLDAIAAALRRASALVSNLSSINHPTSVDPGPIHVNDATASLGRLLDDVLGTDVELELRLRATDDLVAIDATRFEQVVLNLVINACDAMAGHGRVVVATTATADDNGRPELLLTVTDRGGGMDAATRAHAFEPFFTTKETGRGLGLATTRLIVESVGGSIDVESYPGAGATFSVQLPLAPAGAGAGAVAPPGTRATEPPTGAAGSRTILVVDDEPELLVIARDLLEDAGYGVLTAGGAAEAEALLDALDGEVDLLLTDIVMPGLDGGALAASVLERRPELPVVFMTGRHPVGFVPPRANLPLLSKPFGRHDLLDAVAAGFAQAGTATI